MTKLDGLLRLLPAISEGLNLLLALSFDLEAEAADSSNTKFMTMMEGILYEFKGKSKAIHYRHRPNLKSSLIKAVFMGCTDVWEQLLQSNFKNMNQYLPKTFYSQFVERRLQMI